MSVGYRIEYSADAGKWLARGNNWAALLGRGADPAAALADLLRQEEAALEAAERGQLPEWMRRQLS